MKFDNRLTFDKHVNDICKTAGQKLNALSRVTPYMELSKRRVLVSAFFMSQFNYCPLVWMCHSRTCNNKINRLHERCLRLIFNDRVSPFCELLVKDESVSIHQKNLRTLVIEMYKVLKELSPSIFSNIFNTSNCNRYELRNQSEFVVPFKHSVRYGSESIAYLGPKLWEKVPSEMKNLVTLNAFKAAVKKWIPVGCPCKLCKIFV